MQIAVFKVFNSIVYKLIILISIMDISQLLTIASNVNKLKEFIQNGGLADLMSQSELDAAKASLSKAMLANNPDAQIWLAIGHLESAHQILLKQYKGKGRFYDPMAERARMDYAAQKDKWTLFLMAVCYKYFNEKTLSVRAIAEAKKAHTNDEDAPWISYILTLPQLIDPRLYHFYSLQSKVPQITDTQLDQIWN